MAEFGLQVLGWLVALLFVFWAVIAGIYLLWLAIWFPFSTGKHVERS